MMVKKGRQFAVFLIFAILLAFEGCSFAASEEDSITKAFQIAQKLHPGAPHYLTLEYLGSTASAKTYSGDNYYCSYYAAGGTFQTVESSKVSQILSLKYSLRPQKNAAVSVLYAKTTKIGRAIIPVKPSSNTGTSTTWRLQGENGQPYILVLRVPQDQYAKRIEIETYQPR